MIKAISDEMIKWKSEGTKLYRELPQQMFNNWREVEPLRDITAIIDLPEGSYKTWKETINKAS